MFNEKFEVLLVRYHQTGLWENETHPWAVRVIDGPEWKFRHELEAQVFLDQFLVAFEFEDFTHVVAGSSAFCYEVFKAFACDNRDQPGSRGADCAGAGSSAVTLTETRS